MAVGMMVFADRDAVMLPDGREPQRRRFEAPAGASVREVLIQCGVPLHFVDGAGLWVVLAGDSESVDSGVVAGVVRQVNAADGAGSEADVLFAVDGAAGDFALHARDDQGAHLLFRSVPGPVDEVVAAARQGRVWRPDERGLVDNVVVRDAVAGFAAEPGPASMMEVLRQCMGGELLLDVSGSDPERPAVRAFEGVGGEPSMAAFTNQDQLSLFQEGQGGGAVQSLAVPGSTALALMLNDPSSRWLYVDPAGPTCALARADVEFAVQGTPKAGLKDVLTHSPSQQEIFTALTGGTTLFLGERERQGKKGPTIVQDDDGGSLLAVFTSAAEVAAHDPMLVPRQFSAGWMAEFTFRQRLGGLMINPAGPSAVVPSFQIWHILANPALG